VGKTVDIGRLSNELESICNRARELEAEHAADLAAVHPAFGDGARNLIHYLALRQSDISALQEDLASLGLSSLGRAERNVMGSIEAVQKALHCFSSAGDHDSDRTGINSGRKICGFIHSYRNITTYQCLTGVVECWSYGVLVKTDSNSIGQQPSSTPLILLKEVPL